MKKIKADLPGWLEDESPVETDWSASLLLSASCLLRACLSESETVMGSWSSFSLLDGRSIGTGGFTMLASSFFPSTLCWLVT